MNKLFTPFQQGDAFTTGAGLGISICDTIIKRMNGTLDFESAVDQGTTATIIVPLEQVTVSEEDGANVTRSRVVSDELASLTNNLSRAQSQSKHSTRPPTPAILDDVMHVQDLLDVPPVGKLSASIEDATRLKVLVVDDNQIARKVQTKLLSSKVGSFARHFAFAT